MLWLSKLRNSRELRAEVRQAANPGNILTRKKAGWRLALVVAASCASWHGAAAQPAGETIPSRVVATNEGPVQGRVADGVAKFLGIPYAAPPVGDLRWRPPQPPEAWTDVLEATKYGPICALATTLGVFSGPPNDNEDCLYLNVFTPDLDPSAKLPVIVWIHGGGNVDGETPGYDGSKLARQGRTVVVTMEYRLNLMGFIAHPALDNEGHLFGNYGILDQQAVLRWVQRNIAHFGGDKDNVTVGGESAGAADTGYHMLSPFATGLFQRAICQSFCPAFNILPKETAEEVGVALAVAAGCGPGTGPDVARCLRNLTAAQIEALAGTVSAESPFVLATAFGIVDGAIIPDQPATLFANGRFNHVPLMNGNTSDEANFFLAIKEYFSNTNNALRTPLTADQYLNLINAVFAPPAFLPGAAAQVLAVYLPSTFKTPQLAADRLVSDNAICTERRLDRILASQIPVYAYEFADRTAPSYFPDMPGYEPLAYHTSDIQYVFPGWHGGPDGISHPLNAAQTVLSDRMVAAWTNFAWTGNPNGHGNHPWPRYAANGDAPAWLIQGQPFLSTLTDEQYGARRHCGLWDSLLNPSNSVNALGALLQ